MECRYKFKNNSIEERVLKNPHFSQKLPNIKLNAPILCYYNGTIWNIVPLENFYKYPLIYDTISEINNNKVKLIDITICFCPLSGIGIIYEGRYTLLDCIENNCIVLVDKHGLTFPILDVPTRKWELEVKTLRNAISSHPDCQYMDLIDDIDGIINKSYLKNKDIILNPIKFDTKIHPKTIVHLIQYKSKIINKGFKYTVIVGQDTTYHKATGYDVRKNGVAEYLHEMDDKIREKFGFITPMFWFASQIFFPKAKIIFL